MGNLSDYITLTISFNTVGITRAGFGVPMYLSATAAFAERIRFYADLASVAVDFPVTTSAEYLAAQAAFSQSPAPTKFAIGRSALKPTLVYQLTAVNPTGNLNFAYLVNVKGKGVTPTQVSFTSDGTPTDAEFAAGMVTALNAVVGKNFTATGAASPVSITGTTAGDWFSIEVVDPNTLKVAATHVDPGVATDLAAINTENSGWYALLTGYNSKLYSVAAAAWVEANGKIYGCESNDTNSIVTATGNAELLDTIKTNSYTRTMGFYHPAPNQFAMSALFGRCLPLDPGSVVFAYKTLAAITPVNLTSTQRGNLISRRASSYETVGNLNITFGGTVGDPIYNYLDVRRDLDWVADDMLKAIFGCIAANNRLPYTDPGIAVIAGEMRGSLKRAVDRGIFAEDPATVVTVPAAADLSAAQKASRVLPNAKWSATGAGAIAGVTVNGVTA